MSPPRGVDLWADLGKWLWRFKIDTAFDVGANVGQSAVDIVRHHPQCRIWCFEPVAETYRVLQKRMGAHALCETHPLAFGSRSGRATMAITAEPSGSNHLLASSAEQPADPARVRDVEVVTLDDFVQQHEISRIDFLKIDTEGSDLDVLHGGRATLAAGRVGLIQVEAGMNPENSFHVGLQRFVDFLHPHDFLLFGLYEQVHEWPTAEPHLRRANAVFVSRKVSSDHRGY